MHRAWGLVPLLVSGAVAGCGASSGQEVQAKLQQFAHAVAGHDAGTLCRQVLAPALVQRFADAGLECEQAMQTYFQSVTNPTLSVSKVKVSGSTASAVVLASAQGQQSTVESVRLVSTAHGWRLASLATPR